MSIELIHKSLKSDCNDYESLLSSLLIIKTMLDCDTNKKVKIGVGYEIIQKLFNSEKNGKKPKEWFCFETINGKIFIYSCFKDRKLYYHQLDKCKKMCIMKYYRWTPEKTCCINDALKIASECPHNLITFKEIADIFVFYLSYDTLNKNFNDIHIIIDALCDLLKQRIYLDKILKKNMLSLFD